MSTSCPRHVHVMSTVGARAFVNERMKESCSCSMCIHRVAYQQAKIVMSFKITILFAGTDPSWHRLNKSFRTFSKIKRRIPFIHTYWYLILSIIMSLSSRNTSFRSNPIKIFYHVFAFKGTWRTIVPDQMNKLLYSGLLLKCKVCHVTITGPEAEDCRGLVEMYPNTEVLVDPPNQTAERVTLLRMHDLVEQGDHVLYIHSKGVTRTDPGDWMRIYDWRNTMEWFLIHKYEECLENLRRYDVVGVNLSYDPNDVITDEKADTQNRTPPHFSGNFWWCTGEFYLRHPRSIASNYLAPEMYILSVPCTVRSMYQSNTNHYHRRHPFHNYIVLTSG